MELIMGLSLSLILLGALGVFLSYLNLGPLSQQIWQGFALIGISKDYIRFSTFILFGLGIALFLIRLCYLFPLFLLLNFIQLNF